MEQKGKNPINIRLSVMIPGITQLIFLRTPYHQNGNAKIPKILMTMHFQIFYFLNLSLNDIYILDDFVF